VASRLLVDLGVAQDHDACIVCLSMLVEVDRCSRKHADAVEGSRMSRRRRSQVGWSDGVV